MREVNNLEDVVEILRKIKFKATRPTERRYLPPFMQDWSEEKISSYYNRQKEDAAALEIAINYLRKISIIEKTSRDLVALFDKLTEDEDWGSLSYLMLSSILFYFI